jgi:hypothetical protein
MDLIQNSGDVLNIVIAVAVALLVLFVCWGLFYLVMTVRNLYKISKEAREGFSKVSEVLSRAKEQLESGTFYLSLISGVVKKGVKFLRDKTGESKDKKKNSKSKKNNSKKTDKAKASKKTATGTAKKKTKKS